MRLIKSEEVVSLPRGRKVSFDGELLKVLASIKPGNFGLLDTEFPNVKTAADKSKVSGIIRKHWEKANPGSKCSVKWTPDNIPQVGAAEATV